MPPFSVIITAANETGGVAMQAIHGITLMNYGTTYSVHDIFTETTYSYVATDVTPLVHEDGNQLEEAIKMMEAINLNYKTASAASNAQIRGLMRGLGGIAEGVDKLRRNLPDWLRRLPPTRAQAAMQDIIWW